MICPKCGKITSQEAIKCPACQFDFNNAFDEFIKKEKQIHNKIIRIRIKKDKQIYDGRINITNKLFEITNSNSFKLKLNEYNISPEEWNCIEFKIISKIYLNECGISDLKKEINNILDSYDGDYKFKINILSKNLTNLINLAGINPFSKYYYYQLNNFKLSIVEGLEVLGLVIEDLLYGTIKLEDLDIKIKNFLKQRVDNEERKSYENKLNKAIEQYFILTGKDYISISFEKKLKKYDFSIQDVYNIKERFLKEIILKNSRKNLEKKLDETISYYFSKNHVKDTSPDINEKLQLVGDTYSYYDTMSIGKGLKRNKSRKQKRRKKKYHNNDFIPIVSEELGGDDSNSYEDQLNFEKEILGDY